MFGAAAALAAATTIATAAPTHQSLDRPRSRKWFIGWSREQLCELFGVGCPEPAEKCECAEPCTIERHHTAWCYVNDAGCHDVKYGAWTGRAYSEAACTDKVIDWRVSENLREVESQGSCGSCWAFAAGHTVQDRLSVAGKPEEKLSIDELVDCVYESSVTTGAGGQEVAWESCDGGRPIDAFEYMRWRGGLGFDSDNGYDGRDDTCRWPGPRADFDTITMPISGGSVADMEAAVRTGPIAVAFKVYESFSRFNFRWGGVYECAHTHIDANHPEDAYKGGHAVELVGYTENYWILKNSWGSSWGDNGFFYMKKGINTCDIETRHTVYPQAATYYDTDPNTEPTALQLKAAKAIARRHTGPSGQPMDLDKIVEARTTLVAGERLHMTLQLRDPVVGKFEIRAVDLVIPPEAFVVDSKPRARMPQALAVAIAAAAEADQFAGMLNVLSDEHAQPGSNQGAQQRRKL